jgi:non-ribosomal peptide synthase protein (TIGR01720 family)
MGQIDRVLHDASGWKPLVGFNGAEHSARARRSHLFEIEGLIFEGRLQLAWTYNRSAHERTAIEQLTGLYRSHLLRLIQMSGASFQSFSPSDFPAARIESEALSTLVQRIQS